VSDADKAKVFALVEEGDSDGLQDLLKEGVSPNFIDDESNTPLIKAAEGEAGCLEVLVGHGTNVSINHQNLEGMTALMKASAYGDTDCVEILLEHNADKTLKNKAGQTAIDIARDEDQQDVLCKLDPSTVREPEPPPPPTEPKGRRGSVSSESHDKNAKVDLSKVPVVPKSDEQKATIHAIIADNILFKSLDKKSKQTIVDAMSEKRVSAGETVINQGESGDFYYIVDSGNFNCFVKMDGFEAPGKQVMQYSRGGAFGELALMYSAPRAATVVCAEDAVLWAVDRETFRMLILSLMVEKRKRLTDALAKTPLLSGLGDSERAGLADMCEDIYFKAGDLIIKEGESGSSFYILLEGSCIAFQKNASGDKVTVMDYKGGDYFGELAILGTSSPSRRASIEVTSDDCHCVQISEAVFGRMLGAFRSQMEERAKQYQAHV